MKSATRAPAAGTAASASVEMATSDTASPVLQHVHVCWHKHRASFDKLRMRKDFGGTKTGPHPELVEGRTAFIPAYGQ
jgi:hypothetical protein